jgi:hypothetical protein
VTRAAERYRSEAAHGFTPRRAASASTAALCC